MTAGITIGISLKSYFDHARALAWFAGVASLAEHPAIAGGAVRLFVLPTFLQLPAAVSQFDGTRVLVGAQDVSAEGAGPFTGEVTAAEIAAVGGRLAALGHAERRRRHGETDAVVAAKAAAALSAGLVPVVCVGEENFRDPDTAAAVVVGQVRAALASAPAGEVIVAYEPVWAIGAREPASFEHVRVVVSGIRETLRTLPGRKDAGILYGGAAGPGSLAGLDGDVDGVFLGRFAHDLGNLARVLDEADARVR